MTKAGIPDSTSGYAEEADDIFIRYESYDPEDLLNYISGHFPPPPANVIDIGAGTGRDAAWFAQQGYKVTAVEPVEALRARAKKLHPEPGIDWVDDALPHLSRIRSGNVRFDIIMLSAVWMHFDKADREIGMASLAALANPGAVMGMTLRHGPVPEGRRMFDVSPEETTELAARCGFSRLNLLGAESAGRPNQAAGVTWSKLAFRFDHGRA